MDATLQDYEKLHGRYHIINTLSIWITPPPPPNLIALILSFFKCSFSKTLIQNIHAQKYRSPLHRSQIS